MTVNFKVRPTEFLSFKATSRGPLQRRKVRAMTLIELLVAGALFGLFSGMVAKALVTGHRTQDALSTKLESVRRASLALDLWVRDIQAARFSSKVTMGGSQVPTSPTVPDTLNELVIRRGRAPVPPAILPETVAVGYWYDPASGAPGAGMIRRNLYDPTTLAPWPGEPPDGRVLVRGVRKFVLSRSVSGGLVTLRAEISVDTVGAPVTASVCTEIP